RVVSPMKCEAPEVITGTTWAPASTIRRQTSTALYAAIPPHTPRTTRRPVRVDTSSPWSAGRVGSVDGSVLAVGQLGLFVGDGQHRLGDRLAGGSADAFDLVGVDLLEGDRQRLAGRRGHLRRDDGAERVAELVVVRVDLPGAARRQGDEGELGSRPLEELLDGGLHHGVVAIGHVCSG